MHLLPRTIGRERAIKRIERAIPQCEARLERHGGSDEDLLVLRERLAEMRGELAALRQVAPTHEIERIRAQLALWAGNRDPLPDPYRGIPDPFPNRGRPR